MREMLTIYFIVEHNDFGETIEEISGNYFDYNVMSRLAAKAEIAALLKIEDDEKLRSVMEKISDDRFAPEPWGETWRSFLKEVYSHIER